MLHTSDQAYDLALNFASSRIRHELVRHKNFIEILKRSGYRDINLVYDYNSEPSTLRQEITTEIHIRYVPFRLQGGNL